MGASDRIHVLAVDYRGYGYSSVTPTEQGLITDGIAVVEWALKTAKIPSNRIVLIGQSLGTAVATAVAEHFASEHATDFAGLVLVAAFSDLPSLLTTYSLGGVLPLLSPLRALPKVQQYFTGKAVDGWPTNVRLANLVRSSRQLNLFVIHALDDWDIPFQNSDVLFKVAANATSPEGLSAEQIDNVKIHQDCGHAGWTHRWVTESVHGRLIHIDQVMTRSGGSKHEVHRGMALTRIGHNRIMTHSAPAAAVVECFERTDKHLT